MTLSAIYSEAYNFFRNHLSQLAALTMPLLLVQVMIQSWLGSEMLAQSQADTPVFGAIHGFAMMGLLLVFSLLIAALTVYLEVRSKGFEVTPFRVLKESLIFVPPLLLAGVFSGLAVLIPFMLFAAFGPLWLIGLVMSFYVFSRLAYVNFMVVVERITPLQAIKASFEFSGPIVLKTVMVLMLYLPLSIVGSSISMMAAKVGVPLQLLADTAMAFFSLFVNVALFRLYMVNRKTPTSEEDNQVL
ncbi:hypothetical protein ACFOD0_09675 [Shewanella intestini]|uniref:ABC transporter permease n=1 Tax=Shewanella intestini TaxID=2017544 RepID=A0ABS5I4H8_9GAMM|nr:MULTISPECIES: hypothetical protein [Shewanella]MBR9728733.1 hypothetical protein [Shewanella intestini]MRG36809.1 hypothetical protein [Shewanella sp. XMDDZSB0408]